MKQQRLREGAFSNLPPEFPFVSYQWHRGFCCPGLRGYQEQRETNTPAVTGLHLSDQVPAWEVGKRPHCAPVGSLSIPGRLLPGPLLPQPLSPNTVTRVCSQLRLQRKLQNDSEQLLRTYFFTKVKAATWWGWDLIKRWESVLSHEMHRSSEGCKLLHSECTIRVLLACCVHKTLKEGLRTTGPGHLTMLPRLPLVRKFNEQIMWFTHPSWTILKTR